MIESLNDENDITTVEKFDGIVYPTNFPYPSGNPFGLTHDTLVSFGIHTTFVILSIITPLVCFFVVILLQVISNQMHYNSTSIYEQSVMVFIKGVASSIVGCLLWVILFIVYKKYWEK